MSSLKDKLYNYEQVPPEKAWDKIAAALDESHIEDKFPSQLYNAEAAPPASAWNKIAGALEQEPAITIPVGQRSFSFFRYAAAAILIGLVAFGVVKWMNNGGEKINEGMAVIDSTHHQQQDNPNESNAAKIDSEKESTTPIENTDDVTNTASVKTSSAKRPRNNYSVSDNSDASDAIYAYNDNEPRLADRYIMYMTPDGGIVRMAKKWGNLVCCVSGQEQDEDCKDQLKKWQEKLARSPVATSNFMDIFSLVNTLNDTEL